MRCLVLLAAISAVAFGVPLDGPKKFTGYRLVSADAVTAETLQAAETLGDRGLLDVWSHGASENGSILFSVAPEHFAEVKTAFTKLGARVSVLESDIQKLIDEDQADASYSTYATSRPLNFNEFETYEQINASLNYYSRKASALPVVKVFSIGKTVENRDIYGIQISNSTANKPIIFMECGIHAREWASTSTCLYIIDQLITRPNLYKQLFDRSVERFECSLTHSVVSLTTRQRTHNQ